MMDNQSKDNRWRYYVDKNFQNRFIFGFSAVILLTAIVSLGVLWMVRKNPYSLLPDQAAVLVNIDASRGIVVSKKATSVKKKRRKKESIKKKKKRKKKVTYVEDIKKGTVYFPVQITNGKLSKYNAFDIYWYPIVLFSLLNMVLVAIFGLFFSHKMAGPVYRIKSFLRNYLSTGEAHYLNLRKRDHFKDIAVLLNQVFKLVEKDTVISNTNSENSKITKNDEVTNDEVTNDKEKDSLPVFEKKES